MRPALDKLKYDVNGLVAAIIQDAANGQVLALFWMNREALERTIATGKVHSYSRSRKRIALKGETSGHVQAVKDLLLDCDGDAIVIKVDQHGAACHEGYRSCFFRKLDAASGEWNTADARTFDPAKVYGS